MTNLDVALTLRLINQLSGPSKAAEADLKKLRDAAGNLDKVKGGEALGRGLDRARTSAESVGAAVKKVAADAARLSAAGTATARLGNDLRDAATAGRSLDAALDRVASDRAGLAGVDAAAQSLANNLERAGRAARTVRVPRQPRDAEGRPGRPGAAGSGGSGGRIPGADRAELGAAALAGRAGAIAGPVALAIGSGRAVKSYAEEERRLTRIGITAEATRAEMRAVSQEAAELAKANAMAIGKVFDGYEALAAQGRKMGDIRSLMPSVAATAQASGAEVSDIANTAGAMGEQLRIGAERMQSAFDILVAAGNAGKFELKDMARYLPSLAPLAASIGLTGEEGLKRLAALAQVVRNQTGTAEEAYGNLRDVMVKMETKETQKKFEEFGVNVRDALAKAKTEGRDLVSVFVELTKKATGGDLSKLPQLFGDLQSQSGMRALLTQPGETDRLVRELSKADGATLEGLRRVLADTQADLDRLGATFDRFKTRVGEALAPAATPSLEWLTESIELGLADAERARNGEPTNIGRNLRVLRNLIGTGQAVDQDTASVVKAGGDKALRDGIDRRRAELDDEIARQRGAAERAEAPLRRGANPAARDAARRFTTGRIAELEAEKRSLATELDEMSRLNIEIGIAELQAAGLRTSRMAQPMTPRAPEFGFFPTDNLKRNVSFGIEGAPRITPTFGAAPQTAPLPPERSGTKVLDRLEDVLGASERDLSGTAAKTFDGVNAAIRTGADAGVKIVSDAVAQMRSLLSFTASPTILPRLAAPVPGASIAPSSAPGSSAPAAGTRSAGLGRGGLTITGPVHVHGVRDLASLEREFSRVADRRAEDARGDALHDTGSYA